VGNSKIILKYFKISNNGMWTKPSRHLLIIKKNSKKPQKLTWKKKFAHETHKFFKSIFNRLFYNLQRITES
jgi:hypothetical protein